MSGIATSLANKVSYRLTYGMRQLSQQWERRRHAASIPAIDDRDREIVDGLETQGVFVTHLDRLAENGIPHTDILRRRLDELAAPLAAKTDLQEGGKAVQASEDTIMQHPDVIEWGLNERLLAIVENYVRLPVSYRGLTIRRDLANGIQVGTRFWHLDGEDSRIVKIIIYIRDVTPDDGPFCYVPKGLVDKRDFHIFDGNRVADAEMGAAISSEDMIECTGPAGTVVFADPCSIWHKGKTGTQADRYTAFFAYNSTSPLQPDMATPMFDAATFMAGHSSLSETQRRAIS
jgi:hypothetical protein